MKKNRTAFFLLLCASAMLVYGVLREEVVTVWMKAVRICLECIGIG